MAYLQRRDLGGLTAAAIPDAVADRVAGVALVGLLGAVVLGEAAGGPEWFLAWRLASLFLLFVGVLMIGRYLVSGNVSGDLPTTFVLLVGVLVGLGGAVVFGDGPGQDWSLAGQIAGLFLLGAGVLMVVRSSLSDRSFVDEADGRGLPALHAARLTLLVGLLLVVYQSNNVGTGLGVHRTGELLLIFLTLIGFCVLAGDPRRYSPGQWAVIGCFAAVVGLFYYHTLSETAGGLPARRPLWSSVLMGVGLIVLPQYVSKDAFLWALSRLAAGLVVIALPIYIIGEYTLFGMQIGFHNGYTVPLVGYQVEATRSIFVNRNAFALVVFAGLIAAAAELHRAIVRDNSVLTVVVPSLLFAINGCGLALAYGRALWVLTPMALGIYLAAILDRRLVPFAIVGALVYFVGGIYMVHSGVPLPGDPPTRASRWYPALEVLKDNPSLFGQGLVVPGEYIGENNPDWRGGSPHNSYVSILVRIGFVGGLAYVGTIATSVLRGLWNYRSVDTALLALAVGYAAHQMFEAYTMFRWGPGSVFATLAVGFLAFGWSSEASSTDSRE